jgi:hypothetical protein
VSDGPESGEQCPIADLQLDKRPDDMLVQPGPRRVWPFGAGGTPAALRSGEFDDLLYDQTWLAGHLRFTAGDMSSAILADGRTSISMPFTFTGELANYESDASRATPGSVPLFSATFTGSGLATANFRGPFADPNGALFFADSITYDFVPAAPTPEPASLLLVGTGVAGLVARRRVQRNAEA